MIMTVGDFNAKVDEGFHLEEERNVIGRHGLGTRPDEGNLLLDIRFSNNFTIANALFQQHKIQGERTHWYLQMVLEVKLIVFL